MSPSHDFVLYEPFLCYNYIMSILFCCAAHDLKLQSILEVKSKREPWILFERRKTLIS